MTIKGPRKCPAIIIIIIIAREKLREREKERERGTIGLRECRQTNRKETVVVSEIERKIYK